MRRSASGTSKRLPPEADERMGKYADVQQWPMRTFADVPICLGDEQARLPSEADERMGKYADEQQSSFNAIDYLELPKHINVNPESVKIHPTWKSELSEEFSKPYFAGISDYLRQEIRAGKIIYPPGKLIFNAFDTTPFDQVKVVIIGQDPYHQPGQAMGLSFSVPRGTAIPASLRNIYKELHRDIGMEIPDHGDLTKWAEQGVFLLNAMLTVERGRAGAHRNIGWQSFTDAVIRRLSDKKDGLVFMLWGNFAKSKKELIDEMKHHVMESVHPSPLAGDAFQGCAHFSKTNELLQSQGQEPIDWTLT